MASAQVVETVDDIQYARAQLGLAGDGDTAEARRIVKMAYERAQAAMDVSPEIRRLREEFPPGTVTSQRVEVPWWAFWRR